jgi:hypothetical protein
MSDRRFTRAAIWLGTRLAVSGNADGGEWVTALLREAAAIGFAEPIVRGAFGEIGAIAERYGTSSEMWSLSPTHRQLWANFAAANNVPAITNTPFAAIVEFWKPKPVTPAPAAPAAPVNKSDAVSPELERFYARQREDAAARVEQQMAYYQKTYGAKQPAEAPEPRIDSAKYAEMRREAVEKARRGSR